MAQAATGKTKKIFDGRYEILSIVGRGSGSVVYHARNITAPFDEVALKVLVKSKASNSSSDQLRKEALAMVSSRHKYTVRLDDFHSVGQLCYLAMEYAPEGDLRKYFSKLNNQLPITQIERFVLQIAEALAFIHQAGILHRDIKPENILVINNRQSRLADFGVAVLPGEESSIEDLQKGVGTMDYMAPEVLEGIACNKASDVYMLAVTFYEILTGKHPFRNTPLARVIDVRREENFKSIQKIRPDCPDYLQKVLSRAMAFEPSSRYQNARELYEDLLNRKSEEVETNQDTKSSVTKPEPNLKNRKSSEDNTPNKKKSSAKRPKKRKAKRRTAEKDSLKATNEQSTKNQDDGQPEQKQADGNSENRPSPRNIAPVRGPMRRQVHPIEEPVETEKQVVTHQDLEPEKISSKQTTIASEAQSSIEPEVPPFKFEEPEPIASQQEQLSPNDQDESNDDQGTLSEIEPEVEEYSDNFEQNSSEHQQSEEQAEFEGYQESDFYHSSTNDKVFANKDRILNHKASKPGKGKLILIVIAGLLIANYLMQSYTDKGIARHALEFTGLQTESDLLPAVDLNQLDFPNLPAGKYSGSITGLIRGVSLPLSIIRVNGSPELIVAIGIDGWIPARVVIAEQTDNTIRVRSGGFILSLSGNIQDQKIQGDFQNSINKEEGTWFVEPIQN